MVQAISKAQFQLRERLEAVASQILIGDADATVKAGLKRDAGGAVTGPIIVNSSRAVLYASSGDDFASAARRVAMDTRALLNAAAR